MTNFTVHTLNLPNLHRHFIGADRLFDEISKTFANSRSDEKYPPYNVIKFNDTQHAIEVAVAGFSKDDITVEITDNVLTISGENNRVENTDNLQYIHKGISERSFERVFTLTDNTVVRDVTIRNGLLTISLEYVMPEHKKSIKLAITD